MAGLMTSIDPGRGPGPPQRREEQTRRVEARSRNAPNASGLRDGSTLLDLVSASRQAAAVNEFRTRWKEELSRDLVDPGYPKSSQSRSYGLGAKPTRWTRWGSRLPSCS